MKSKRASFWVVFWIVFALFSVLVLYAGNRSIRLKSLQKPETYLVSIPIALKDFRSFEVGIENEDVLGFFLDEFYPDDIVLKLGAHWGLIEKEKGVFDWSSIDTEMIGHRKLYISARGSTAWANGGQALCMPVLEEHWDDYVAYMIALLERYHPDYLAFWNEPEADTTGAELYIGCFGNKYEDGVRYAKFADYVIARLKPLYPETVYVVGELLNPKLDFAAGLLDTIQLADAVSFHVYEWCNGDPQLYEDLDRLESLSDLDIILSETSVIYLSENVFVCEQAQVEHLKTVLGLSGRVKLVIWYTGGARKSEWRNSDMIVLDPFRLKPVWYYWTENR